MRITFTGVDKDTLLEELKKISNENIEWGILIGGSIDKNRYPGIDWIKDNINTIKKIREQTGCSFALHVCGKYVNDLLEQTDEMMELIDSFNRVQINFIYKENKKDKLIKLLKEKNKINFIVQYNHANKEVVNDVKENNLAILYDYSGGRGIKNENWEKPIDSFYCGYAGGLGLENIKNENEKIKDLVKNENYWIDMESKIRTNDKFDLNEIEKIIMLLK